jgi:hypothetical protein
MRHEALVSDEQSSGPHGHMLRLLSPDCTFPPYFSNTVVSFDSDELDVLRRNSDPTPSSGPPPPSFRNLSRLESPNFTSPTFGPDDDLLSARCGSVPDPLDCSTERGSEQQ